MGEDASDMARRAWVQAMFTQRVLHRDHALALWKTATSICGAPFDRARFKDFLSDVSESLDTLGFDVLETKDQSTNVDLVCIINLQQDAPAELASSYSKPELQYIKRLIASLTDESLQVKIELIFTAPNATYCINSLAALREAGQVEPPMSKRACQDLLNNLILHGWIRKTPRGRYTLTQRSLLELRSYLEEGFPAYARKCKECQELLTIVSTCRHG
ncbi:hypothetical protein K437DRAFT_263125 [Tilletiaria anomala UBC 951]|uniref:Non-structural maintenance of chromosomes element 1 homolog n=1 Tax=Tilletiaria anomala (strain ATCC 24038 / CBS 436.72 / UBC 951) TaxID=1037660 RepID=A0A066W1R3_TILAU|nr:uncharacterized protein K437DRAFT_263125 [Tilletiaria anomala UBC 951]KDN44730.1 hypothetical protein K437DRAFT_263125 [Tilletiaria anomala UBC 951]